MTVSVILAIVATLAAIILGVSCLLLRRRLLEAGKNLHEQNTLHHEALKAVREERDRLLDALGDAFFIIDDSSIIRFTNQAAIALFQGNLKPGRHIREAIVDPRVSEVLQRSLATGEPSQTRVVHSQQTSPRGDLENRGQNAWIIDVARLPASHETRVVIRDVTSEHQLDQIRKDFVANASHELRTPLAIISGYLENLLDDDLIEDSPIARRFLGIMRKHTERIARIVEDMLVISRLESGEASALNIEPFKLRSCINDILERLESLIRQNTASIRLSLANPDIQIHGDRFYWTQALFNLVENALKQNPYPGLVIEIGCRVEGGQLLIWVSDNGVGIPSSDLPHIFRRFYRVDKHHSQNDIKGTGLGLSIVKRAIEAHQGTIGVSSTPGQETKFLITIPSKVDG